MYIYLLKVWNEVVEWLFGWNPVVRVLIGSLINFVIATYAYTPIRLYAYTPIRLYAYTPIRLYAYTPIRLYTPIYAYIRLCAYTPLRLYHLGDLHAYFNFVISQWLHRLACNSSIIGSE